MRSRLTVNWSTLALQAAHETAAHRMDALAQADRMVAMVGCNLPLSTKNGTLSLASPIKMALPDVEQRLPRRDHDHRAVALSEEGKSRRARGARLVARVAMPSVDPLVAVEEALRRCPVLFFPSRSERFVGRESDLVLLGTHLDAHGLAVLFGTGLGVGTTRLAVEFAHSHAASYPGGVVWVCYRGSNPKEAAADVIEALDLPTPVYVRFPFVSPDDARATMWRGLGQRGQSLLILDGWSAHDDANDWLSPTGGVHVIAIAQHGILGPGAHTFQVGGLDESSVSDRLGSRGSSLLPLLTNDALALDVALARLERGPRAGASPSQGPEGILLEAIVGLSKDARTLLQILTLLDAEPVPLPLLDATLVRLREPMTPDTGRAALDELCMGAIVQRTVFDEPCAHVRVLGLARERWKAELSPLREPVLAALVEMLPASAKYVHLGRRVAAHAWRALACDYEGLVPDTLFDELLERLGAGPRHAIAATAARKAVSRARARDDKGATLRALKALGRALSETRELDAAQDALREAVTLAEVVHGRDALEVAEVIEMLRRAIGLGVCGDAGPEASELTARAHEIYERSWSPEDPRLVGAHMHYALHLAVSNHYKEAAAVCDRAMPFLENCDVWHVTHHLLLMAPIFAEVGRGDEALNAIDRAVRRCRGPERKHTLHAMQVAAEVLSKLERRHEVLRRVDEILSWDEWTSGPEDRVTRARLLFIRAGVLEQAGDHAEARSSAARALPVLAPLYGEEHFMISTLRRLAE
jgi:tetratricopeptide (TPR) repeat protein